jgi:hypothetical protein
MSERYKPRTTDQLRPYLELLETFVLERARVTFIAGTQHGKLRAVA